MQHQGIDGRVFDAGVQRHNRSQPRGHAHPAQIEADKVRCQQDHRATGNGRQVFLTLNAHPAFKLGAATPPRNRFQQGGATQGPKVRPQGAADGVLVPVRKTQLQIDTPDATAAGRGVIQQSAERFTEPRQHRKRQQRMQCAQKA